LPGDREPTGGYAALLHKTERGIWCFAYARISFLGFPDRVECHKGGILWSNWHMEELQELGFVGRADYIDRQEDWEHLDQEFFTVLVDELLGFLEEYYLPL
jgi:hypothetical protein